ncbi:MAG: hypothetical protein K6E30_07850 [Lachnospiraceae bacterium]|nr:hypothetical protein [Lachnospiraceae bacterium]
MKNLWTYIENKNWKVNVKNSVVLATVGAAAALAGFTAWLLIRPLMFSEPIWAFCFAGYPLISSCYGSILYLFRHEFQNGSPLQNA